MNGEPPYPAPPWETFGFGIFCPLVVRARDVALPPGLEPVAVGGRTLGLLGYVEYRPPSPLVYSELLWMPARVRWRGARGYFVARMYVDHEGSLAAGRELWALPKTLARFERREGGVTVHADDGTRLSLDWSAMRPTLSLRSRVATLQPRDRGVVRFRADFTALVRPARVRVSSHVSDHPGWTAFPRARRVLGLGSLLERFESTMHAPTHLE